MVGNMRTYSKMPLVKVIIPRVQIYKKESQCPGERHKIR